MHKRRPFARSTRYAAKNFHRNNWLRQYNEHSEETTNRRIKDLRPCICKNKNAKIAKICDPRKWKRIRYNRESFTSLYEHLGYGHLLLCLRWSCTSILSCKEGNSVIHRCYAAANECTRDSLNFWLVTRQILDLRLGCLKNAKGLFSLTPCMEAAQRQWRSVTLPCFACLL